VARAPAALAAFLRFYSKYLASQTGREVPNRHAAPHFAGICLSDSPRRRLL